MLTTRAAPGAAGPGEPGHASGRGLERSGDPVEVGARLGPVVAGAGLEVERVPLAVDDEDAVDHPQVGAGGRVGELPVGRLPAVVVDPLDADALVVLEVLLD